eukprot:6951684-Ditylum_brightwellii.AAC.1
MSDFDAISNDFQQLIKSTHDSTPDHDICWPQHSPDPVFQLKQDDLPFDCYVDIQLTATNSSDKQHGTSYYGVSAQRFFDLGGTKHLHYAADAANVLGTVLAEKGDFFKAKE